MEFLNAVDMVFNEYAASVEKHGTWADYSLEQMMAVIIQELLMEAGDAESRGDLHGEHGVIRELAQVSACCIKAIMELSGREGSQLCR